MPEIKFQCPYCGQHLSVDVNCCGQEVLCPTCQKSFVIPPLARPDITVAHVSPTSPAVLYAGFWRRFAAAFIDAIILAVIGFIGGAIFGALLGGAMGAAGSDLQTIKAVCGGFGYIIGLVLNWLYFTLFESSSKQATWGKMAIGICVTNLDGQRLSFARANGRYWGKIISFLILCIGYLMVAFTQKKQGLHDIMAGCLVTKK